MHFRVCVIEGCPENSKAVPALIIYCALYNYLGVQTAQGQGSDGPTVKDITAGEGAGGAGNVDGVDKMSSVLPTMWLGAQSGW